MSFSSLGSIISKPLKRDSYVKDKLPLKWSLRKRDIVRSLVREHYTRLALLRKKLRLGKLKFEITTTNIGSLQIFAGFKPVLPSSERHTVAVNSVDMYESLNSTFLQSWHKYLFRLLVLLAALYFLYSSVGTILLQLFFWDNIDFTPLVIKYPAILTYSSIRKYFSPSSELPGGTYKHTVLPFELLSIFILDV